MSQGWELFQASPKGGCAGVLIAYGQSKQLARVVFRSSMASLILELRRKVALDARLGVLS